MSNELVTMPNGTEVVSMAVTVTNMSATTNQNDYAETLNVAAEYITAIKWQEGGTKNPIPFYGKYLGFIDVQKIDQTTGEVKTIKTAQLMGGFSENGVIKNAFYVAAQATLVGALEQIVSLGLTTNLLKITCLGTKPNKHGGATCVFSVIPLIKNS